MLDQLGAKPSAVAPEEVGESGYLLASHREHAEVVEVVLPKMEVRQLGRPHHEEQWPQGNMATRTNRQRLKASVASDCTLTTAPTQPSSGSSVSACSGRAMAFHG